MPDYVFILVAGQQWQSGDWTLHRAQQVSLEFSQSLWYINPPCKSLKAGKIEFFKIYLITESVFPQGSSW